VGPGEALAILAAGIAAGSVNAAVGSGSLITFPTLLAFGFPPVVANVSNNVGLVPGNISGAFGYRRELAGQRRRLIILGAASAVGAAAGAVALLVLPATAFRFIVPVLILVSCALVLAQPRLSARLRTRRESQGQAKVSPLLSAGICLSGVYGGYFGAAQGVLVIGLLGSFLDETLQRINGAKNVLVGVVNGTAAVVFILFAHVSWIAAALIAVGSTIGGLVGARFGRRLPPAALRLSVVAVGLIAAVKLIFF
jgi:uncharacterized membrane protein YfcA